MPLSDDRYLDAFAEKAAHLARVLAAADPAATVRACPGWTVGRLGQHVGEIHQWAEHAVVAGNPDAAPTPPPVDPGGLAGWYSGCATSLLGTLRATDPAAPAWAFGPKPRVAGFWFRRQAHEVAVHLWDATDAVGEPAPIEPDLAVDGVDEVLTVFLPRQVRLGRIPPLPAAIDLVAGPERWSIGEGEPAAAVGADPETALLLLWGRRTLDDPGVTVTGDRAAAAAVLAAGVTP